MTNDTSESSRDVSGDDDDVGILHNKDDLAVRRRLHARINDNAHAVDEVRDEMKAQLGL